MNIHKLLFICLAVFTLIFSGCGSGEGGDTSQTGTVSLNLTDAPLVDEDNVTGVFITISSIEYHTDSGWNTMKDFNTSVNPINLLEWQDGASISLGDFEMPAGTYTQIRFMLDVQDKNKPVNPNAGCFIEFDGDRNETLYVSSGSQTGYKAIGTYDVPVNGTVNITADFDVRKSIVTTGRRDYKLKPTIKLVVTNEAGSIDGNVTNLDSEATYVMYAYSYKDGVSTWNESEANDLDPSDDSDIRFENAATSSGLKEDGTYTLSFLSADKYDLILAEYAGDGEYTTFHIIETEVVVESGEVTTVDMSL